MLIRDCQVERIRRAMNDCAPEFPECPAQFTGQRPPARARGTDQPRNVTGSNRDKRHTVVTATKVCLVSHSSQTEAAIGGRPAICGLFNIFRHLNGRHTDSREEQFRNSKLLRLDDDSSRSGRLLGGPQEATANFTVQ